MMQPLDHIPEPWSWLPKRRNTKPRTAFVEFATWDVPQTVKELTQHMLATFNVNRRKVAWRRFTRVFA